MTTAIIITFSILILIAYAFDLSSKRTKIPTVILLLLLGWIVKQLTVFWNIEIPQLKPMLPILGTVGLILIVLEGGLDLELNKSKKKVLTMSALSAFVPMIVLFIGISLAFSYFSGSGIIIGIVNAIPLCVISSAIAIPSAQNLSKKNKEFIIYESSMSDIFGVILFNFFTTNAVINMVAVGHFFLQLFIMLFISLIASMGMAFLIRKIDHHVKFIPILMMVILIYNVAKIYHLPALIFILIFGLLLNNLDELKNVRIIKKLEPDKLDAEVRRFKEIVIEIAFLVRTMFFLLFGFLIDVKTLLNPTGLIIASSIVAAIVLIRYLQLKMAKMQQSPILFIAPRGLITILLFLSIPVSQQLPFVNEALMIQIVLLSALLMMVGLLFNKQTIEDEL